MSISLNNVNSEVVRAHKRIDMIGSIPNWKYLGMLSSNGQQLSVPQNAVEVTFLQIDSYHNDSNYDAATSLIVPADLNGFGACIQFDTVSLSPRITYNNRIVKMINKFDNNVTKVYYR